MPILLLPIPLKPQSLHLTKSWMDYKVESLIALPVGCDTHDQNADGLFCEATLTDTDQSMDQAHNALSRRQCGRQKACAWQKSVRLEVMQRKEMC
jgi:hypothetical protein